MRLYGCAVELAFLLGQLVSRNRCVWILWRVRIGDGSLGWKLTIFYEDVELWPAAKPIFAQACPELRLFFLCSVVNKDRDVAAEELELLASGPVWRSHVRERRRHEEV